MNEKYSETPRTDESILVGTNTLNQGQYVSAEFARQLERELIVKSSNYALAHENLGREVVKCGQLANDNKNLMRELAEKNETANVFMEQVKKLQAAMTDWRYGHDEIEAACGGDTAILVRAQVTKRRVQIDLELAKRAAEPSNKQIT